MNEKRERFAIVFYLVACILFVPAVYSIVVYLLCGMPLLAIGVYLSSVFSLSCMFLKTVIIPKPFRLLRIAGLFVGTVGTVLGLSAAVVLFFV